VASELKQRADNIKGQIEAIENHFSKQYERVQAITERHFERLQHESDKVKERVYQLEVEG